MVLRPKIIISPVSHFNRSIYLRTTYLLAASCAAAFLLDHRECRRPALLMGASDEAYQKVQIPQRGQAPTHVIYGTLMGDTGIHTYDVYRDMKAAPALRRYRSQWLREERAGNKANIAVEPVLPIVKADVVLGEYLDGHVGTVHGGILALMVDDFFGHAYEAVGVPMAVTANLNMNYRAPVPGGARVCMMAELTAWEGRKLFFALQVVDGSDNRKVCCDATCLYIIPRPVHEKMLKEGFVVDS